MQSLPVILLCLLLRFARMSWVACSHLDGQLLFAKDQDWKWFRFRSSTILQSCKFVFFIHLPRIGFIRKLLPYTELKNLLGTLSRDYEIFSRNHEIRCLKKCLSSECNTQARWIPLCPDWKQATSSLSPPGCSDHAIHGPHYVHAACQHDGPDHPADEPSVPGHHRKCEYSQLCLFFPQKKRLRADRPNSPLEKGIESSFFFVVDLVRDIEKSSSPTCAGPCSSTLFRCLIWDL